MQLGQFPAPGPRRDRVAGSALTRGLSAWLPWVLAAEIPTVRGRPAPVGQHVDLRAGVAAIDRARTGQPAP